MKKKPVREHPHLPFWLSTKENSLLPNRSKLLIENLRLIPLKQAPYPEKFKNKLVRLFKIYGFKNPLEQIYVPLYLKNFGGRVTKEKTYDYTNVNWDKLYYYYLFHMLVNFTEYGTEEGWIKLEGHYDKEKQQWVEGLFEGKITSVHPTYIDDYYPYLYSMEEG